MKLHRWFLFSLLFILPLALLGLSLSSPAAARDYCICQPATTYYHSSYAPPSYAWTAPVYVSGGPGYGYAPQPAWSGNVSNSYRSSRAERRSRGGSRLSGHSTDHWSQQLNWCRP